MTLKIKSIEDAVDYLFTNTEGWIWKVRKQGYGLGYCVVKGNPNLLGKWIEWGTPTLEVLNKHIYGDINTYNPVFDKIKQMEQRFKERQHA